MARKGSARIPDCHPDEPHHSGGLCKRCHKREWYRAYRQRTKCAEPRCARVIHARGLCAVHYMKQYQTTTAKGPGKQAGSFYPQEIVRIPVKGWGYLVA